MTLPGITKPDTSTAATNTAAEKDAARRYINWHARTDQDARQLLDALGLDPA